ncbi:hypothetical protein [uncultured Treponema sp.]|uniref:hypothetical protein n=1 Tax=uncultured Treponema sp. TaxID=162155 RepID=UPI0025D02313|nr:hypothetical protein [uncultured Treponema sp.]
MGNNQKYSIDFKLLVVGKYRQGSCGYKKLARKFNLDRDTVRAWCLSPKLQSATQMGEKKLGILVKIAFENKSITAFQT